MKVIILAGGLGTRISEETSDKPKPMVLIDTQPILWHVMNIYAKQSFTDFIVAAGYKQEVIRDWVTSLNTEWQIEVADTGLNTQTAGRIRKCMERYPNEPMMATYGDGLGNIDIGKLLDFHEKNQKTATLTAVRPPARFGVLEMQNGLVTHFGEKRQADVGWINGGFFVLDPKILNYIHDDSEPFEVGPLNRLVAASELSAFQHENFWQPMDTLREKNLLAQLVLENPPAWLRL